MLQHKYGDSEITAKGCELIDEYLGRLREEDALLAVYSDHGHTNINNTFVVNRWLDAKGYLTFESEDEATAEKGLLTETLRRLGKGAKRQLPGTVTDAVRPLYRRIVPPEHPSSVEVAESIDWENSAAAATSQGPIYLNRDLLGDDYESIKSELKSELESLTHDGDTLLASVKDAEEVYSGRHSDDAPDLVATAKEGWEIYGGLADSTFVTQATSWTSGNHPSGIVLLAGDGVKSMELPEHSILDVMPTILSYMDCPIPEDVDGSVIQEPFEKELSTEKTRPVIQPDDSRSNADEAQMKESLKDLGYLE
jgi:predicted AlkP superfamily phosphohydrolase/phosphomutase